MRREARANAAPLAVPDDLIVTSRFQGDAWVRGAAAIAIAHFLDEAPFASGPANYGPRSWSGPS